MSIVRIGGTNRYSDVVVFDKRVYLSGVVPNIYAPVYEQTKEILTRIESILTSAGSSKKNILNMTIYLIDEKSYEDMNRAFDEWIPKDCAPARATIGNVKFPNPLWKVEITLIACTSELPKQEMNSSYINYIV
jgi:enamine deaminase RidA (YjgF/YER057c/UK114 family)